MKYGGDPDGVILISKSTCTGLEPVSKEHIYIHISNFTGAANVNGLSERC